MTKSNDQVNKKDAFEVEWEKAAADFEAAMLAKGYTKLKKKEVPTQLLKFSKSNDQAKLQGIMEWWNERPTAGLFPATKADRAKPIIYSFSLPSGYACPFALDCLSKADRITGKITDGKNTKFRCFSASDEARSPQARAQRWHNFDLLRRIKTVAGMVELIEASLPKAWDVLRIHIGGDFFNQTYFDAWVQVARNHLESGQILYAYTKSLPYWIANNNIPANLNLTASEGGTRDHLIKQHGQKSSTVVFSPEEAEDLGLEIDHNEYHAIVGKDPFALLVHGTQPKGSDAGKATQKMTARGIKYSYSRKNNTAPVLLEGATRQEWIDNRASK